VITYHQVNVTQLTPAEVTLLLLVVKKVILLKNPKYNIFDFSLLGMGRIGSYGTVAYRD